MGNLPGRASYSGRKHTGTVVPPLDAAVPVQKRRYMHTRNTIGGPIRAPTCGLAEGGGRMAMGGGKRPVCALDLVSGQNGKIKNCKNKKPQNHQITKSLKPRIERNRTSWYV